LTGAKSQPPSFNRGWLKAAILHLLGGKVWVACLSFNQTGGKGLYTSFEKAEIRPAMLRTRILAVSDEKQKIKLWMLILQSPI
jgi:hypothetical protein